MSPMCSRPYFPFYLIYRTNSSPPDLQSGHGVATDTSERGGSDRTDSRKEDLQVSHFDANENFVVADAEGEKTFCDVQNGISSHSQAGKSDENVVSSSVKNSKGLLRLSWLCHTILVSFSKAKRCLRIN